MYLKYNDPSTWYKLRTIFNYPGVWAIINYRIANKLYIKVGKNYQGLLVGII